MTSCHICHMTSCHIRHCRRCRRLHIFSNVFSYGTIGRNVINIGMILPWDILQNIIPGFFIPRKTWMLLRKNRTIGVRQQFSAYISKTINLYQFLQLKGVQNNAIYLSDVRENLFINGDVIALFGCYL